MLIATGQILRNFVLMRKIKCVKIGKCVKIEKSGCPAMGVVLEIRTHPDKRREGGLKIRDFNGRPL